MRYPILYQVNTRLWLDEIGRELGRPPVLDDISDQALEQLAALGFDWLYLICTWQTGEAEAQLARSQVGLIQEAEQKLGKDGRQSLCSSCFAISGYAVPDAWGGSPALLRLKERLNRLGLRLMLDFIPNHTGISHPWARSYPDYYVNGSLDLQKLHPERYSVVETGSGPRLLAHGRDPYFAPWIDTLQLNYANTDLQEAMTGVLLQTAHFCDGLRCDMAMLILPDVFVQTWGLKMEPFWEPAIAAVKQAHPDFVFLAEAYWDRERELLGQGFDYAYDKQLYDRLYERDGRKVFLRIQSEGDSLGRFTHFLENHDEPRAAAVFEPGCHQAAALLTYLLPGLRFFFAGQLEGHRERAPVQFCSSPPQVKDETLGHFYSRLMEQLNQISYRENSFHMLQALPAWSGNERWANFTAFTWMADEQEGWLAVVNYSPAAGQSYLRMSFPELHGRLLHLEDVLNAAVYEREGDQLLHTGLYVDLPAWGFHLFRITPAE